jgi:hypothetical protein
VRRQPHCFFVLVAFHLQTPAPMLLAGGLRPSRLLRTPQWRKRTFHSEVIFIQHPATASVGTGRLPLLVSLAYFSMFHLGTFFILRGSVGRSKLQHPRLDKKRTTSISGFGGVSVGFRFRELLAVSWASSLPPRSPFPHPPPPLPPSLPLSSHRPTGAGRSCSHALPHVAGVALEYLEKPRDNKSRLGPRVRKRWDWNWRPQDCPALRPA